MTIDAALTAHFRRLATCLLAVAWVVAATACSEAKRNPLPPGSSVLVLGDSISAGYGLDPAQAWPAHLAQSTGWNVINGGVSGDTAEQGLARLAFLLESHRPTAVIIELGGNDMLRRLPEQETRARLSEIIAQVRAASARPILMAVPKPSVAGAAFGSLSDADFYAEVAKKESVVLLPDVISEVLSESQYKLDQLHPNAEGSRVLADRATAALKKGGLL